MRNTLFSLLILLVSISAEAAPINYTFSGTMTGSLGGSTFTNANYEISINSLTELVSIWSGSAHSSDPLYQSIVPSIWASIDIDGFGSHQFMESLYLATNSYQVFLTRAADANTNIVGYLEVDAFWDFDLTNDFSIGPPSQLSSSYFLFGEPVATEAGLLDISLNTVENFSASVVPVPPALGLFGSALLSLGWKRR